MLYCVDDEWGTESCSFLLILCSIILMIVLFIFYDLKFSFLYNQFPNFYIVICGLTGLLYTVPVLLFGDNMLSLNHHFAILLALSLNQMYHYNDKFGGVTTCIFHSRRRNTIISRFDSRLNVIRNSMSTHCIIEE